LGEGPGRDAAARHHVVAAASDELVARWSRYGPAVAELGVHSVASAPLRGGSRNLGAVTAFDAPPEHRLDELAGVLLLPVYNLGLPLLVDADVQAVVHQAAGMTAVQQGCGIDDAIALIRAHAFASNRSSAHVAAQIVNRRLRLD
jgi:ANTAR domain-containing protein